MAQIEIMTIMIALIQDGNNNYNHGNNNNNNTAMAK